MTPLEAMLLVIGAAAILGSILSTAAAYRNGVTDGYGYSREPNCPGYAKAGEHLRSTMAHRWPELRDDPGPGDHDDADLR